ncbi:MAG TPA: hypothetical protein VIM51_08500 [Desulfosporosinus sp.]
MSSISSTTLHKNPPHQAVIIPFDTLTQTKKHFHPCIFCGNTMKVHKFKGKTVCVHCLRQIPAIFSCG